MAKKRVLNSKNPKYWAKKTENKPKIKKRFLFGELKGVKCTELGTKKTPMKIVENKVS